MKTPGTPSDHEEAVKAGLLRFAVLSAFLVAVFAVFIFGTLSLGWFGTQSELALIAGVVVFGLVDFIILFKSGLMPSLIARARSHG